MSETKEVTDETFEQEVLKAKLPVMVDFWASWCRPCMMIAPVVEELAKKYEGKLKVCKVNIDTAKVPPQRYGIMSIPTIVFFKDGVPVGKTVGSVAKATLEAEIKKHI